jgi:hypothetical protein
MTLGHVLGIQIAESLVCAAAMKDVFKEHVTPDPPITGLGANHVGSVYLVDKVVEVDCLSHGHSPFMGSNVLSRIRA